MQDWMADENKIKTETINAIMGELECLLNEPYDTSTANYWLDNAHNVFAFINDNGDDDKWIEIHYELYDVAEEDWLGNLLVVETEYTSKEDLLKAVKEIVDMYYGD